MELRVSLTQRCSTYPGKAASMLRQFVALALIAAASAFAPTGTCRRAARARLSPRACSVRWHGAADRAARGVRTRRGRATVINAAEGGAAGTCGCRVAGFRAEVLQSRCLLAWCRMARCAGEAAADL